MVLIPRFLNVSAIAAFPGVAITNIGLPNGAQEGPRISWDIMTDLTTRPNQGVVDIWNLSGPESQALAEAYQQSLIAAPGTFKLTLSIGWDSKVGIVTIADPYEIQPDYAPNPVDRIMRITCGDGGLGLRDGTIGMSLAAGDFSQMLQVIAVGLKAGIEPASLTVFQSAAAAAPVQLFESFTLYGDPKEIMDQLMESLGLQWWILNSTIIITLVGAPIAGPPVILAPQTGLVHFEAQSDGSILLDALADPNVIPGVAISVNNEFGIPIADGLFRVFSVRYQGDTRTDSKMTIRAKKALIGF